MRRPLLLLTLSAAVAAPLSAGAEVVAHKTPPPAPRATAPVMGIQSQPLTARLIKMDRPNDFTKIRVKDSWTYDDGFRIAKGKLNFRHRF